MVACGLAVNGGLRQPIFLISFLHHHLAKPADDGGHTIPPAATIPQ